MPSRQGQKARDVRQRVWVKRVRLSDGQGGRVEVSCLVAREEGAPEGVKPVEWRLLTNRTIDTFAAATELIDWYRARWEIELFFHVLKNGCRVEALQLASVKRLERALSLISSNIDPARICLNLVTMAKSGIQTRRQARTWLPSSIFTWTDQ
jgi:IS4 transposase